MTIRIIYVIFNSIHNITKLVISHKKFRNHMMKQHKKKKKLTHSNQQS